MAFLLSVAAIWAVAVITPGPNLFVVLTASTMTGRSTELMTAMGVSCGTLAWGIAGWLGISAAFATAPVLYVLLKTAGAIYLIWIGLKALRAAWKNNYSTAPDSDPSRPGLKVAFLRGLYTNLANPKTAIFVSSLFAATLPQDYGWQTGMAAVATMVVISLGWYAAIALFFASDLVASTLRAGRRVLDALAGTVFMIFGVRLGLSG